MHARTYSSLAALPPAYAGLFEHAAATSFCLTSWWFETLAAHAMDGGEELRLVAVESDGPASEPLGLLVGRCRARDPGAFGGRTLASHSNFYSMAFAPLVAAAADPEQVLGALFEAVRAGAPRYDWLRFQPLAADAPLTAALGPALRAAGYRVQRYFLFGNRYEDTAGVSWGDYLARRPSLLRETIRRKGAALDRSGRGRVDFITGGGDGPELERGIADYHTVYGQSWKTPEPHPRFMAELMRACAAAGALRLGVLHVDGVPAAAQFWIVWRGVATIYKLAHDRRFEDLSPGTVLTMRMMRRVLDEERVAAVDFGAGDDAFKADWMSGRRERWGLLAFDPGTVRGAAGILRHIAGRAIKRAIMPGSAGTG